MNQKRYKLNYIYSELPLKDRLNNIGILLTQYYKIDSHLLTLFFLLVSIFLVFYKANLKDKIAKTILGIENREKFFLILVFSSHILFLTIGILQGKVTPQPRYLLISIPFLLIILLSFFQSIYSGLLNKKIQNCYFYFLYLFLVISAIFSVLNLIRGVPTLDRYTVDIITWINKSKYGSQVLYDFLGFGEQPIMLYTQDPILPNLSWSYSYQPGQYKIPKHYSANNPKLNGIKNTIRAHQHIYYQKIRYVILPSDDFFKNRISHLNLDGYHQQYSYIRDYLKIIKQGEYILSSPFIPRDINLKIVYENKNYQILENDRGNLLKDPHLWGKNNWQYENYVKSFSKTRSPNPKLGAVEFCSFNGKGSISQFINTPIRDEDEFTAGVWLWSKNKIKLQIKIQGITNKEQKYQIIDLENIPKLYMMDHQFKFSQDRVMFLIKSEANTRICFYAWGAYFGKGNSKIDSFTYDSKYQPNQVTEFWY